VDDCGKKKSTANCGFRVQKERKDSSTQDAESTEDTEKIEAEKAKWKEKRARLLPKGTTEIGKGGKQVFER